MTTPTPFDRIARMSTREIMLDAQRIKNVRLQLAHSLAALDRKDAPKASILERPETGLIDGGLAG